MSIDGGMESQELFDGGPDAAAGAPDAAIIEDASSLEDAARSDAEPACTEGTVCVLSALQDCVGGQFVAPFPCDKGCLDGACNTACDAAKQVIDQSQADEHAVVGSPTQWQTFKVAETGILTALELRPNVYSMTGEPSLIALAIYVGEGIAGERIARQEYTLASVGSAPWHTFEFEPPVPLQAGQTYTWAIDGAKSVYYATNDVYPDGRAWTAARDMTFRVHAAACH